MINASNIFITENNPKNGKYIAILEKNKCIISSEYIKAYNDVVIIKKAIVGIKNDFKKIEEIYPNELRDLLIYHPIFDQQKILFAKGTLQSINSFVDNADLKLLLNLVALLAYDFNKSTTVIDRLNKINTLPNMDKKIESIIISHDFTENELMLLDKFDSIKKGIDNNSDTLKNIYLEWENKNGDKKSCKLLIDNKAYVINDVKNADNLHNGSRVIKMNPLKPKENSKLELFFEDSTSYIIDKLLVIKYFDEDINSEKKEDTKEDKNKSDTKSSAPPSVDDLKKSQEKYNKAMLSLSDKSNKFDAWKESYDKIKTAYDKRKTIVSDIISKMPNKAEIAKKDLMAYKAATNQLANISWIENAYGVNRMLNLLEYKEETYKIISKMIIEKMNFTFDEDDYLEFQNNTKMLNKLDSLITKILPEDIKEYILPYEKWVDNYNKYNEELDKIIKYAKEKIYKIPLNNIKKDEDFNEDLYKIIINSNGDIFEKLEASKWFYLIFSNVNKKKNENVNVIIKNKSFSSWLIENKGK